MYLSFKPLFPEDRDWFYTIATRSDATPFRYGELYGTEIPSREAFFEDWKDVYFTDEEPLAGRCYAIEVEGRRIGMIAHGEVNEIDSSTVLDILIADRRDTSQGYGSRSLSRFAAYLYSTLGVMRCRISVPSTNTRAIEACRKAGFALRSEHNQMIRPWQIFEREFQLEER